MGDWRGPARNWFGYVLLGLMAALILYLGYRLVTHQCIGRACGQPGVDQSGPFGFAIVGLVAVLFVVAIILGRGKGTS